MPHPDDTAPETTSLSGGEIPAEEREDYLALRALILQEPDVHEVLALSYLDDEERWLYLIKTPFASWPKFVIGTTDAKNESPEITFRCGQEWSARQAYDEQNFGSYL